MVVASGAGIEGWKIGARHMRMQPLPAIRAGERRAWEEFSIAEIRAQLATLGIFAPELAGGSGASPAAAAAPAAAAVAVEPAPPPINHQVAAAHNAMDGAAASDLLRGAGGNNRLLGKAGYLIGIDKSALHQDDVIFA